MKKIISILAILITYHAYASANNQARPATQIIFTVNGKCYTEIPPEKDLESGITPVYISQLKTLIEKHNQQANQISELIHLNDNLRNNKEIIGLSVIFSPLIMLTAYILVAGLLQDLRSN